MTFRLFRNLFPSFYLLMNLVSRPHVTKRIAAKKKGETIPNPAIIAAAINGETAAGASFDRKKKE